MFYWLFKWNMILTSSRQNKLYGLSIIESSTRYIFNSTFTIFLKIFCFIVSFLFRFPFYFNYFVSSCVKLIFINWILSSFYSVDIEDFFLDYPFIWFAWYYILSSDYNLYTYINSTGGMKYTKFYDNFLNWIYYSLLNTYVIKNQKI